MSPSSKVDLELPKAFEGLFRPSRYKVFYGGRGSSKSWTVARALLATAASKKVRILCAREFQNSITDSVHKLLVEQIYRMGLERIFRITQNSITSSCGSEFIFKGLRNNINSIKSLEGVDVCWVEEAHTVSKTSWSVLVPTIRTEGSEIWVTFNPELEDDETYQRFVVNPPSDAIVKKVNWEQNPWFPDVLRKEKDELKERDPDSYLNVWEGHCRQTLEGAVYAKELREAQESGRITKVPYDPTVPVSTFWDLGWADNTVIWFAQAVGFEYRIIDYIQGSQKSINEYLKLLQEKPYIYDKDHLPHDGKSKQLGTGRSIQELMQAAGRDVVIVPKLSVADGINAARTIFPNVWIDEEKCADGLQCLRHYRYDVDPDSGSFSKTPLHDWASHGADGFRYLAVSLSKPGKGLDTIKLSHRNYRSGGWMR